MRIHRWQLITGALLLALSAMMYIAHYAIFRDSHHIFSYLLTDLAFLPVEVFLVTMIIHQVLTRMESKARLEKLNMIIGVFFSEMGTKLLASLAAGDADAGKVKRELDPCAHITDAEFRLVCKRISSLEHTTAIGKDGLEELGAMLASGRGLLMTLMENQALLEHESFTDLLLSALHLSEELAHRTDIKALPEADLKHLNNDARRIYAALVPEWLTYMRHLKSNYPFLFSLALRTNPFDRGASAVVRE